MATETGTPTHAPGSPSRRKHKGPLHPLMEEWLQMLRLENRAQTARSYGCGLRRFWTWAQATGLDPQRATSEQLHDYQRWLVLDYRSANGQALTKRTQSSMLSAVKVWYDWLERRALAVGNAARDLKLPSCPPRITLRDHLDLQEATAMVQAQAAEVERYPEGCYRWARELRDLAVLCTGLATGRRRSGLKALAVADVDFDRSEIRCSREKGRVGRVLPIADWALMVLRRYVDRARPILNEWHGNDLLFVGNSGPHLGHESFRQMLKAIHERTVEANPDLTELGKKTITPHSLRVTFATMLFRGGCNIRSVNELMLHRNLGTTARYTPVPVEDLGRVCRAAHPRG